MYNDRRPRRPQQEGTEFIPRRRVIGQRPVDLYSSTIHYLKTMPYKRGRGLHEYHVPSHPYYCHALLPPCKTPFNPSTAICTQWAHTIFHPDSARRDGGKRFTKLEWSPSGGKLLASTTRGEFMLMNGYGYGVEMKTIAHEDNSACRALSWLPVHNVLVSGGDDGTVKMWLPNFVQLSQFDSNQGSIREITFSAKEHKFCTAGQHGSARIWDTNRAANNAAEVENKLEGHGGDVHCVDWHPTKALIITGSQDREARLWDPTKGGDAHIATIHQHTEPVTDVKWHSNGNWFLTSSRDCTARLWDLRNMKQEVTIFQGHSKDVTAVAWHPSHPNLFASCGMDGVLAFWVLSHGDGHQRQDGVREVRKAAGVAADAHDGRPIVDVKWHPLGHVCVTASNEIKVWTRNKPGAVEEVRGTDVDD